MGFIFTFLRIFHRNSFCTVDLITFTMGEAKDAFVIFDEAYEGNDVDAFYLGDILRALGCTLTNKSVVELGGATELGATRIKCAEVKQVLCSLAEKMEEKEANNLMALLEIAEDEDGLIKYMDFIDKLLAFKA